MMRISVVFAVLVATAASFLGVSRAAAQVQLDIWDVSASAAAKAGLDSKVAPIILGNALAVARKREPDGVRSRLTQLQLMLAYVAVDQYNLFNKVYGAPKLKFDVSEFDQGLKDYIPTLRKLQDVYYKRWQDPHPEDKGVRLEALSYAAKHFAELEVALRRRIAPEEQFRLADALANRGLAFKRLDEADRAIDDYREALDLLAAARRLRNAIDRADRAFAMGDARLNGFGDGPPSGDTVKTIESLEPLLHSGIIIAVRQRATDAISEGDQSGAWKYIELMEMALIQGQKLNTFVNLTWPCHANLAATHVWQAVVNEMRMNYARKFEQDPGSKAVRYFNQADAEFRKALEIEFFSGGASNHLKDVAAHYVEFLKGSGHEEEAERAATTIESLDPADVGRGGPEAWREALDCPQKSR